MRAILQRLNRIEHSLAPKVTTQDRRMAEIADLIQSAAGSGSRWRVCHFRNQARCRPIMRGDV
jgi:hypothetical protein